MRRDQLRRTNRPWQRRRGPSSSLDPAAIFKELQRRCLTDLEDCRLAWARAGDLLAVCVAITKCDLPEWLADALLVILTDEAEGGPRIMRLRQRWARRRRDALDAVRVETIAVARDPHLVAPGTDILPRQTWESAHVLAELYTRQRYRDVEAVSDEAMKATYRRVRQRLGENPGRYYYPPGAGLDARLRLARERFLASIERPRTRK